MSSGVMSHESPKIQAAVGETREDFRSHCSCIHSALVNEYPSLIMCCTIDDRAITSSIAVINCDSHEIRRFERQFCKSSFSVTPYALFSSVCKLKALFQYGCNGVHVFVATKARNELKRTSFSKNKQNVLDFNVKLFLMNFSN